ncbi:MAG: lipoprotein [Gammaproteobacteria bacterium]|nr:lipoprotein [Gammaproteobacteria bacterium]
MTRFLLIIIISFVAANCGQKGPLEPPSAAAEQHLPYVLDARSE